MAKYIIDKDKALKKWAPVIEGALGINPKDSPRKAKYMAIFGEYYQLFYQNIATVGTAMPWQVGQGQMGLPSPLSSIMNSPMVPSGGGSMNSPMAPYHLPPSPPLSSGGGGDLLPMNMAILSKINIENKSIYFTGLNDDKLVLRGGEPKFKISIGINREFDDIKLERRAKLQQIASGSGLSAMISGYGTVQRYELLIKNLIIDDINGMLEDGGVLYIDRSIIESISLTSKGRMEAITRYDVF